MSRNPTKPPKVVILLYLAVLAGVVCATNTDINFSIAMRGKPTIRVRTIAEKGRMYGTCGQTHDVRIDCGIGLTEVRTEHCADLSEDVEVKWPCGHREFATVYVSLRKRYIPDCGAVANYAVAVNKSATHFGPDGREFLDVDIPVTCAP